GGRSMRVAAHEAAWARGHRPRRPRLPRQLLRGGCLRAPGRRASTDGVRMGGGGSWTPGARRRAERRRARPALCPRVRRAGPTRTETAILREHARSMAQPSGRNAVLVEFGSGSSRKTELVLAALEAPRAYVPIDVSQSALEDAWQRLEQRFPGLEIVPVNAS